MKQRIILFGLILVGTVTFAQSPVEKGLNTINRSSAEATIGFLASDELQGREAGFHGSYVSSEYIASILQWMGIQPLNESYFQPFDAYRKERQKKGRLEVHPDSVAKLKQEVHQKLSMRNVLAMIPGKNTKEYVIVGAHFDHLGIDPALDGDQIYNGADDNASGVSAVLQIARAFLASGQQPERNVIFAFWDGEEKGLLGSKYFVQTCPFVSQVKGYLNFDMIGRNNKPEQPKHVVYFYTAAHPSFGDWLKKDIKKYGLQLEPDYRAWDNPVGQPCIAESLHQWLVGADDQPLFFTGDSAVQFSAHAAGGGGRHCRLWRHHVRQLYFHCHFHRLFHRQRARGGIPSWSGEQHGAEKPVPQKPAAGGRGRSGTDCSCRGTGSSADKDIRGL